MRVGFFIIIAASLLSIAVAREDSLRTNKHDLRHETPDDSLLHNQRALQSAWIRPNYWRLYKEKFSLKHFKKCAFLKEIPVHGTKCPKKPNTEWYMCMFGEQTCPAITGPLPGLTGYNGTGLGTVHPTTRCTCNETQLWDCGPWNPCAQQFCGGIANFQCPTGLICVDNPTDSCDPNNGGADCGGICVNAQACGNRGLPPCPDGQECIDPDPTDSCDPAADCPGICAPIIDSAAQFCGGIAGIECPEGLICIDAPGDGCDPNNGGADCGGMCVEAQPCGSRSLPPCPEGQQCIDPDLTDNCSPLFDCPGICAPTPSPQGCAGLLGIQCPKGQKCVDDPSSCPIAADCLGICVEDLCPVQQPIGSDFVCPTDLRCTYGSESCCGQTFDSLVCRCAAGEQFGCYYTDACYVPQCKTDPPKAIANDKKCLATVPDSNTACDLDPAVECGYGEVCCCGNCFTETTCTCSSTNNIFECATIAIRCQFPCPNEPTPMPVPEIIVGACSIGLEPQTGDKCSNLGETCQFGETCCCNTCYPLTTCTCDSNGEYLCFTIAVDCIAPCPSTDIPDVHGTVCNTGDALKFGSGCCNGPEWRCECDESTLLYECQRVTPLGFECVCAGNPTCPSQESWPEYLGEDGEVAKVKIESVETCLTVFVIPEDSFVTADFRTDRVRIFVNSNGLVSVVPQIG